MTVNRSVRPARKSAKEYRPSCARRSVIHPESQSSTGPVPLTEYATRPAGEAQYFTTRATLPVWQPANTRHSSRQCQSCWIPSAKALRTQRATSCLDAGSVRLVGGLSEVVIGADAERAERGVGTGVGVGEGEQLKLSCACRSGGVDQCGQ